LQLLLGANTKPAVQVLPVAKLNSDAAVPLKIKLAKAKLAVPVLVMTALRVVGAPTTVAKPRAVLLMLNTGAAAAALPDTAIATAAGLGSPPVPVKLKPSDALRVPTPPLAAGANCKVSVQALPAGIKRLAQDSATTTKSAALAPTKLRA
jgi:hypothetical protein